MCYVLAKYHGHFISVRHLRRLLKDMHLYRRKYFSDKFDVAVYVFSQLQESGRQHGYRWMHLKCRKAGYVVSRQDICTMIQLFDPGGVSNRLRRRLRRRRYNVPGPNFMWHVDSHDKLKEYGICINGCVDGFSRRIIWMEAGCNSNSDAGAGYFLKAISTLGKLRDIFIFSSDRRRDDDEEADDDDQS